MKCKDIVNLLERLSPPSYACDWDNVGLQVGHFEQGVKRILVTLDNTLDAVEYAIDNDVDMIITHHPMIFKGIKMVNDSSAGGRKVLAMAENHIAYFAMHTNFDIMGSMADIAAKRIGLNVEEPLEITVVNEDKAEGIGRVGRMPSDISIRDLALMVKDKFEMPNVMVYGDLDKIISRVAISPGSGKSMISEAVKKNAEVLITGDIGHHEGIDAWEDGLAIIDATHYGLEYIFIAFIEEYLKNNTEGIELLTYVPGCPCNFL
ncbi:MAG: Nif3-like dinuclear metal center hexameric protein [Lachnospiraceae bacterium]|nr:Nif3-like dinuclear metal center hexameric protein [Lachnospiraceae bacterium]